jgi:sulfate transport system permease protein
VVFISGNLPFQTEITPLLIVTNLEEFDYSGAASLGFVMLLASFMILAAVQGLQAWQRRRSAQ